MKSLFLVQKDQKIILDEYYEAICRELGDCELRKLDSSQQSDLKKYFEDFDLNAYDRIIFMLRTKAELRQLAFIRTIPNLVIIEHDACQNYIETSKYKGEFSRYYSVVPWVKVLVSGAQVCKNLNNEGFDAHFVSKGYDSNQLRNLNSVRDIELGFIGSLESQVYSERKQFLEDLVDEYDLQIIKTAPGEEYCKGLNRMKFFISADLGLNEYMVKNFEAMACGCVLFTYNQGEEENTALGFQDMENVVLYSSKKEFRRKFSHLQENPDLAKKIASNGQRLAEESFSWKTVAHRAAIKIQEDLRTAQVQSSDKLAVILGRLSGLWMRQTYTARLIFLMALALVPRLLTWIQQPYITRDAYLYLTMGQYGAEGQWSKAFELMPWMPPLYPLMLSLPERVGINVEQGAIFISMIGSIVLLLIIYNIANMVFKSRHIAELCLLLAAVNRLMVETSSTIGRESLYIPLLALSLNFTVSALLKEPKNKRAPKRQYLLYLGMLFGGLSYCTRQEGLVIIVSIGLFMLCCIKWNKFLFRHLLRKSVLGIFVFILPSLMLYSFFNKEVGCEWEPLNKERTKLFLKHLSGER